MATTKKEAILKAALELFAENGVDATTTRRIARRAKTAEGNLYRHFKSKEELVQQLFTRSTEVFHRNLSASVGGEEDPLGRLELLVRGIFEFADDSPAAFTYLLAVHHTGVLKTPDELRPLPMRLFVETLETGISSGAFRDLEPVLTTGWIVAMAQRAVVLHQAGLTSASPAQVIELTVCAALRLVAPGS